ncbi:hypothetical protein A3I99_04225 [Candidatus Kaiserbacteria bacterium RIFCSPLOWO2_02_FULL_45_11b]|uniref:Uncharacterized protein n=1 Tax=Candidatus Kaiserbacteria bacterium RIFCSPLOWO2_12_FULL_45_26 TaxID=1798525 RepID=A0A1F6FHD6_9BACT|nr:MAG: hypothetical protein A2Z56_01500 [Candidatus Kaiserbacteria bacterium RIFCSPHIGHO2_12_45_16]OGG70115.1 MAG: hypothetical protein A2929_03440 [Candidatus Kaiserbacteria bacterium RIFCSPLOWO2_01_FULL_45_25]OGG83789.1 MAG: hypothetical protein A3I99_04225 [Candidatus Kaiserbacteria bacterium RIFCSPLOWO2_02_FULL_45_11b]OGG85285.1 MAG: hypothetical protein A3G90_04500 [Candidatus Kaiserbacteria bacterium RIFCSPLOWO2_12_FULL_45_26]
MAKNLEELYRLSEQHLSLPGQEAFQVLVARNDMLSAKMLLLGAILSETECLTLHKKVVDDLLKEVGLSLAELNAAITAS